MIFKNNFYKEDGTWFIDLPSWPGDKSELAMVLGADLMLEHISNHTTSVNIEFADEELENAEELVIDEELIMIDPSLKETAKEIGGAFYIYYDNSNTYGDLSVWLCDVTKFVFQGEMPKKIWLRKI